MGPLNAVALSPTSTIESRLASENSRVTGVTPSVPGPNPVLQDSAEIANVPALVQIAPLQTSNPTEFQSVISGAIRQLREAEAQTTDPQELAFLTSLTDRFQQLQEVGPSGLSLSATTGG